MKKHMNLTLNHKSGNGDIEALIELLDSILLHIKQANASVISFIEDCKSCKEMYSIKVKLKKDTSLNLKNFSKLPEKHQVDLELKYYKITKELKAFIPKAKKELSSETNKLISLFLISQLKSILEIFAFAQEQMSKELYPDKSKEILSNPALYQELLDTWKNFDKNAN